LTRKKPNVLLICSDQQHPQLAGYRNHPHVQTPNLDRLVENGTHFTRAYCNSPICTPSRMSFLTGKYVHEIGTWNNNFPLDPEEMTWARQLDQAGVQTTLLGKMDFCGEYQDGGFSDYRIIRRRPVTAGMTNSPPYRLTSPFWGRLKGAWRHWRPVSRAIAHAGPRTDQRVGSGDFSDQSDDFLGNYDHDRTIADWAVQALQERGRESAETPWLLYVGFVLPHEPYVVPHQYFDMYYPDNVSLPVDARFPNENLHPAMRHLQQTHHAGQPTDDLLLRTQATYMGMTTCIDDFVGEILDELEAQGLAEDTYVIFTSDHGDTVGEHGLFFKKSPYEGSVGVPLVIRGPGVPEGRQIDDPVSLIDLYPTLLDVFGLEAPGHLAGCSWLPLIPGAEMERPDFVFSEYHGWFALRDWYMLVRGGLKYVWYADDRPSLFDLDRDPNELNDLALDPGYAGELEEFEKLLRTIIDPEQVTRAAKIGMGLIGPTGEDYSETMRAGEQPRQVVPAERKEC
jgi:choline-sulfatase